MIRKSPNAKKPIPSVPTARRIAGKAITDVDREEAIAIVREKESSLKVELSKLNIEQLERLLERRLHKVPTDGSQGGKYPGVLWRHEAAGEVSLSTCDDGLVVERDGRRGVMSWLELAGELVSGEWEGYTLDNNVDGAADLAEDEPAAAKGKPPILNPGVMRVDAIVTSKDNPRTVFDEDKLRELAASIASVGLIEPLVLNELRNGIFHLVCGERRLRAAKLAGLTEVPARVGYELTPSQVDEIRVVENLQRQDLTAIEEARGFEKMLKAHGYTQEKLGERLGCSQSHIANRLRLLKLPEKWQQRVISQEIPPTHARALLPWVEHPSILGAIDDRFFTKQGAPKQEIGSVGDFEWEITLSVRGVTEAMTGAYEYRVGQHVEIFQPTPQERQELGIVKVGDEERATNVKLWKKLRAKQLAPLIRDSERRTATDKRRVENKAPKAMSEDKFAKAIAEWRITWLQYLLGKAAGDDEDLCLRAVWMCLLDDGGFDHPTMMKALGFKSRGQSYAKEIVAQRQSALALSPDALLASICTLGQEFLWEDGPKGGKPNRQCSNESTEDLARFAEFDLAEHWLFELAGPLTEAFFNLHDVDRLVKLGAEYEIYVKPGTSKAAAIKQLKGHRLLKTKLPSCIQPITAAKPKQAAAKSKRKGASK